MRRPVIGLAVSFVLVALVRVGLPAQGGVGQVQVGGTPRVSDEDAARPAPRLPDGTIDLTGPWLGGGTNQDMERDAGMKPGELDSVLLPWARELRANRREEDEPYTACLPMGVPRHNPYPWKFAMTYTAKGLTHIYVLHETGDAGAHRVVYMDGRPHPEDPVPTWFGHSIGRFDGDTLVIDTIEGYGGKVVETRGSLLSIMKEGTMPTNLWASNPAPASARTKSPPRSARAGWARCTKPPTPS